MSEPVGELELSRGQIPQGGMDPFRHVHVFDEVSDLTGCIRIIKILRQIDFFFLDGPNNSFSLSVFFGLANGSHTDLDVILSKQINVVMGSILNTLITMAAMNCTWQ